MPTTVSIAAASNVTEGQGTGAFQLTRTNTSGPLTVNVSWSGTASSSDYWAPQTASFADGSATAWLGVMTADDTTSEPTETIVATIAAGAGYSAGASSSASIDLYDNDPQHVSVTKIADVTEGDITGQFRVTRVGTLSSSLTVNLWVGGTATSGTDYHALSTSIALPANAATADIFVSTVRDNLVEGGETVLLTAMSGPGYTASVTPASVTITDDAPVITVTATDTTEGEAAGGFTFARTGGAPAESLAVSYTVGGTATPTDDYAALSGTVTFAANSNTAGVPVTAAYDNVVEGNETVTATIVSGATYTIGTPNSATVLLIDKNATITPGPSHQNFAFASTVSR